MGLFLMLSGVAGASLAEVEGALGEFALEHSGNLEPVQAGAEIAAGKRLVMAASDGGNVTVVYPEGFVGWDDASAFLAARLGKPVLSLHIHDGDFWMYRLMVDGETVDQFNPIPDYWAEVEEEELAAWAGSVETLVGHWPGVERAQIERYLVNWETEDYVALDGKAYVDDEYQVGEEWQLTDFMRRMNLVYPLSEDDEAVPAATREYSLVTRGPFRDWSES